MTDNMELWDKVSKTDPKYTKEVGQRGGFTAINAMYQVQEMTRQFGVIGVGWGFDYELTFPMNDTVIANVTLWHGNKEQFVRQAGQKKLNSSNGPDEDAIKKAITDGMTKCFSLLGFNADIFLGMWDDHKYVEQRKRETAEKPDKPKITMTGPIKTETALQKQFAAIVQDVQSCTDETQLNGVLHAGLEVINQVKTDAPKWYDPSGDYKGFDAIVEDKIKRMADTPE